MFLLQSNNLAQCIHYHRKKSGLSRIALAKLAGVSKIVIFNLEHGKITVQLDTLLKVFHVLNIQIYLDSPLMRECMEQEHASN